MKPPSKRWNPRRAELRAAAWARRNAALFHDDLKAQLRASIAAARKQKLNARRRAARQLRLPLRMVRSAAGS